MLNKLFHTKSEEEANKLLLSIFQNAIDGIIVITSKGTILAANPAVAKLFGYGSSEILNKNIKMLMPSPYHEEHDGYLENYHSSGVAKIIGEGREVKGRRKDGTTFDFYLSVSKVQFEGRKNFVGIIHDISKEKERERELDVSRNQFKAVFETAVDGIIIISNRGLIRMANPAVLELFQFELSELLNNNIKMLMPSPYHEEHDGYLSNYHNTKERKIIGIGRVVKGKKKDGTIFPFSLGVSEVKVGEEIMYAGILHDLTLQKKKEDEIIQLNDELELKVKLRTKELSEVVDKLMKTNGLFEEEINQRKQVQETLIEREAELSLALDKEKELGELKSRFVSMASHEFRTPLSTILSSISLIDRYKDDSTLEKRNKHINRIKDSVKNLTGILNDFLSLSKLEEGKVDVNFQEIDWDEFATNLIEDFSPQLKSGQKIIQEYDNENFVFTSDRHLLTNILNNICSNAIKYSNEGDSIICKRSIFDNEFIIEIRDEGLGIPQEEQKHLFSRFYRASNVSTIQGTGLGLTIVKRYVTLLGGVISFESEEGAGTSFFIKLPLNPIK